MPNLFVLGSLNMDLVIESKRLPKVGETLEGLRYFQNPGGKGGNQAVAVARLGGRAKMVGAVGDDAFGVQLKHALLDSGVDACRVKKIADSSTGIAVILLHDGDNRIILHAGANAHVDRSAIDTILQDAERDDWLIMQFETPISTVKLALQEAKRVGMRTLLNPAPVCQIDAEWYPLMDVLVLNQIEAEELSQLSFSSNGKEAVLNYFIDRGVQTVIVTLGAQGSVGMQAGEFTDMPAIKTTVVDSTAAGDTYVGAIAVSLSEGKTLEEAMLFATQSATLTVETYGAQTSIPTHQAVKERFNENDH